LSSEEATLCQEPAKFTPAEWRVSEHAKHSVKDQRELGASPHRICTDTTIDPKAVQLDAVTVAELAARIAQSYCFDLLTAD